jgi:hypothetical protein
MNFEKDTRAYYGEKFGSFFRPDKSEVLIIQMFFKWDLLRFATTWTLS